MSDMAVMEQELTESPGNRMPAESYVPPVPDHKFGMWLFLASEVMFFTGLLGTYLVLRLSDPAGFDREAANLHWEPAAMNTLVLIFSSLTMALSIHWAQVGDAGKTKLFLIITILCGFAFMGIKAYEYAGKFSHGIYPSTHVFYACYFVLTGVHGLHVVGGVIPLIWALGRVMVARDVRMRAGFLELLGLYWHFVDLVWIFLFPLFYLLHSAPH